MRRPGASGHNTEVRTSEQPGTSQPSAVCGMMRLCRLFCVETLADLERPEGREPSIDSARVSKRTWKQARLNRQHFFDCSMPAFLLLMFRFLRPLLSGHLAVAIESRSVRPDRVWPGTMAKAENASRVHEKNVDAHDDTIHRMQVGRTLLATIED